jgi:hypothetical protein
MTSLSLLLILFCSGMWVLHAWVKDPAVAALGTWVMLTVIGVIGTFVSFFLHLGLGHGGPAPAFLPVLVGLATLVLPIVGAFMMKQSKEKPDSGTEEPIGAAAPFDVTPHDGGTVGQKVTNGD